MKTSGTKEWADTNINLVTGCSHDCVYCYAQKMARRFKRLDGPWREMHVRWGAVNKGYRRRKGRVMFPTTHDITPEVQDECFIVLGKVLAAGNEVLVTTKPHLPVIKALIKRFDQFKDQVQFRFTITSMDDTILERWEPFAPSFNERLECLKHAFTRGWKTSVSIEPCLDKDPRALVETMRPFVSESIWLGKMMRMKCHVTDNDIASWVCLYKDDAMIKFKDSIDTSAPLVATRLKLVSASRERLHHDLIEDYIQIK